MEMREILEGLCYYDKRNPHCSVDDDGIEDHNLSLKKKGETCFCDNCFYGRTTFAEELLKLTLTLNR